MPTPTVRRAYPDDDGELVGAALAGRTREADTIGDGLTAGCLVLQ
ncbi:hypothetical protein [Arthrobacter flavus]|uniref:Uncharacterized protein n=1 Tax=Arthrobacter flavus TaxID=95172 RepID=A0ABW4Q2C3_9MICC